MCLSNECNLLPASVCLATVESDIAKRNTALQLPERSASLSLWMNETSGQANHAVLVYCSPSTLPRKRRPTMMAFLRLDAIAMLTSWMTLGSSLQPPSYQPTYFPCHLKWKVRPAYIRSDRSIKEFEIICLWTEWVNAVKDWDSKKRNNMLGRPVCAVVGVCRTGLLWGVSRELWWGL